MVIQNYANAVWELERRISVVNNQLLDIRKRSAVLLSALDLREGISEKKIKRIEDFLSSDVTRFRNLTVSSLAAITGTIGGWTITSADIRNSGGTVKLRGAGNLAFGTTPPTAANTGTGVFIDNTGVYGLNANTQNFVLNATNGNITAIAGTVGGWTLASTTLTGGNATLASTGILTLGTGNDVAVIDAADATYRLAIGHATYGSAPFRVTKAGALTATSATITGSITATSGAIGGWTVDSDSIDAPGGTITMRSAGNLAFGATPPTSATVGTGIFLSGAGLYGLNANTQQFYLQATDGKAYFAGGTSYIDSSGITITGGDKLTITSTSGVATGAIGINLTSSANSALLEGIDIVVSSSGTDPLVRGIHISSNITGSGSSAAGGVYGTIIEVNRTATGAADNLIGIDAAISNSGSTGTTANAYGGYFTVSQGSSAGTLSEGVGVRGSVLGSGGVLTSARSLIAHMSGSGIVTGVGLRVDVALTSATTVYGIHIAAASGGTTTYGLYAPGSYNNLLGGALRIGSGVAPTVALDVTGAAKISTTLDVTSDATFGTVILPDANDGAAIGASGTAWSDLYLASGAVINFAAGDVLITHSSNTLAFTGATSGYKFDQGLYPNVDDSSVLGSTSLQWSDLFLASGAVINFANSDITITHSSNTMDMAGTTAAGVISLIVENTDNTTSTSRAQVIARSGGASAGDAFFHLSINGQKDWLIGVDNSDSDALVFSEGTTLGTGNVFRIGAAGNVTIADAGTMRALNTSVADGTGHVTASVRYWRV